MKKHVLIFGFIGLVLFSIPTMTFASYEVRPLVLDAEAKARDIFTKEIVVTNTGTASVRLFPFVNNVITGEDGGIQEFASGGSNVDRSRSLANWIEISRAALELAPGKSERLEMRIHVNYNAVPGKYHAVVGFAQGSTLSEALRRMDISPRTMVSVEIKENIIELVEVRRFMPAGLIFKSNPEFILELENVGNKDSLVAGEIVIYDRRGREVVAVPINGSGEILAAETGKEFFAQSESGMSMGKYKALLTMHYGAQAKGTLNDTVYFYIMPWGKMALVFGVLLILVIVIVHFLHGRGRYRAVGHVSDIHPSLLVDNHPAARPENHPAYRPDAHPAKKIDNHPVKRKGHVEVPDHIEQLRNKY